MNIEKYDKLLKTVKQRIRNLKEKNDVTIFYSAYFIKDKTKDCILNRIPVEKLTLVRKNLITENPDIVRFELFDSEKESKCIWMYNIDLRFEEKAIPQEIATFKGLGEAEVNEIVRTKLSEIQKQTEFTNLQAQNNAYEKRINELENLQAEYESTIEELEESVKVKSGLKYYAGILGDILESFGIAKDKIGKPMAALMGMSEESEQNKASEPLIKSRIIEDGSNIQIDKNEQEKQEKRKEIIDLIVQYLQHGSDKQLMNVFNIFSDIERNPEYAISVINYLETIKNQ